MTGVGRHRGSALPAAVLVALAVGSIGLAVSSRSASAGGGASSARSCMAAASLEPTAMVAIVDSGIEPAVLTTGTVVGDRIDVTGAPDQNVAAHGTQMATIVAAAAPSARLLDVRVLDPTGSGSTDDVARGIDAATDAGADVVNLSAAVPAADPVIRNAIGRAVETGAVVVVASGNDARDLRRDPAWRALAADPCVVVVGALADSGGPLVSSNRGDDAIDAWTDGDTVSAVGPDGQPATISGTSPAAATVTGQLVAG